MSWITQSVFAAEFLCDDQDKLKLSVCLRSEAATGLLSPAVLSSAACRESSARANMGVSLKCSLSERTAETLHVVAPGVSTSSMPGHPS